MHPLLTGLTVEFSGSPLAPKCDEEAEANARLIAAAPDMLAALKECALQIAQNHGRRLTADEEMALDAARAAIAKATGAAA